MSAPERSDVPCDSCYAPVSGNYVWHAYWCVRGLEADKAMRAEIHESVERDVARRVERIRVQRHENRPGKHRPERVDGATP